MHPASLTLDFSAADVGPAGVRGVWADLDDAPVTNGQVIDLHTLALGNHTLTVYAVDKAGNQASDTVTFSVSATIKSLMTSVNRLYDEGKINNHGLRNALRARLRIAQAAQDKGQIKVATLALRAFVANVQAQSGRHITPEAAALLVADARWVIIHVK